MNGPLRILQSLKWKQLKGVFGFFVRHPFLFCSALPATWQCIAICDRHFGKSHHRDNQANAFRHALWNMLLIKYAMTTGTTYPKADRWAKAFTDWHEDFSPNPETARAMDLHNNQAGRRLYEDHFKKNRVKNTQITQALLPLLKDAVRINTVSDLSQIHTNRLVYLNA